MSTQSERYQKNIIEGINRAFGDLTVPTGITPSNPTGSVAVLVRALERYAPQGNGLQMTPQGGMTLTIGDRTAHFSVEGRWIENQRAPVEHSEAEWRKVRDAKPGAYAKFCKGEITEDELFALDAAPGVTVTELTADQMASKVVSVEKPQPAGAKK